MSTPTPVPVPVPVPVDLNLMAWFVFVAATKRFKEESAIPRGWNDQNKIWWKLYSLGELDAERPYYVMETNRGPQQIWKKLGDENANANADHDGFNICRYI
jgi:hypothetical protein